MSGGLAVTGRKTSGVVRAGAPLSWGDYTVRRFLAPHSSWGLGLDGLGAAGPDFKRKKSAKRLAQRKRKMKDRSRRSVSIATATPGRGTDCDPETG